MLGLGGVDVAAGIYYTKSQQDVLSCKALQTATFDPSPHYIDETMARTEVQISWGGKFRPVFMIRSLTIGKGASLQSAGSIEKGL